TGNIMIATPATPPVEAGEKRGAPNIQLEPASAWDKVGQVEQEATNESLYLTGRPKLKEFLRYVREHAVHPPAEAELIEEWEAASEVVGALEKEEAGAADNPPLSRLEVNASNEPLLSEFLSDPLAQNSFNTVPTEVTFVELDRLVVYQHNLDLTYCRLLEQ